MLLLQVVMVTVRLTLYLQPEPFLTMQALARFSPNHFLTGGSKQRNNRGSRSIGLSSGTSASWGWVPWPNLWESRTKPPKKTYPVEEGCPSMRNDKVMASGGSLCLNLR